MIGNNGQMLKANSKPESFSPEDIEQYRHSWWRKNAVRSILNWYRQLSMPADMSGDLHPRTHTDPVGSK
jgi:hypothetical protein